MQGCLISLSCGLRRASEHWFFSRDGDEWCLNIFKRHYSHYEYADGRQPKLFVGPGEKIVLISESGDALFVWRKYLWKKYESTANRQGINCTIFRNESDVLSSVLISEAEQIARQRWPNERLYTYVNPKKIRSTNPGACFKYAGWKVCGKTKWKGLVILEKQPQQPT